MVQRVHHIDFVVRDLGSAAERYASILGMAPGPRESLESRGVEVVREVEWELGGRSLYFRDPDGHLLELATPGVWEVY